MVPQNCKSILKFSSNSNINKCTRNKTLAKKQIGKLFHYISNIKYLLLVRFGNHFVYSYFSFNSTPTQKDQNSVCMVAGFPQGSKSFCSKFLAIARSFGFMLIPLLLLVVGWWLNNRHFH